MPGACGIETRFANVLCHGVVLTTQKKKYGLENRKNQVTTNVNNIIRKKEDTQAQNEQQENGKKSLLGAAAVGGHTWKIAASRRFF